MIRHILFLAVALLACPVAAHSAEAPRQTRELLSKIPLVFEPSEGGFVSRGDGYVLSLTSDWATLHLQGRSSCCGGVAPWSVLRLKMIGGNPQPSLAGLGKLPSISNYFVGADASQWRTQVPHFAKVTYEAVYPGVDLIYYGNQRHLEFDFVLAPGADPSKIVMEFEGADKLRLDSTGNLIAETPAGEVVLRAPVIFQELPGGRAEIPGGFALEEAKRLRFEVGPYDKARPLVIDPVLSYSTYLGGANSDDANGIAVAPDGSIVIVGRTSSPVFLGGPVSWPENVFVTKLKPDGSSPIFTTFFAGKDAHGVAVDGDGNILFTGLGHFDTPHINSIQPKPNVDFLLPGDIGFVAKLNPAGDQLIYSSLLGAIVRGAGWIIWRNPLIIDTRPTAIAVDPRGNAYVTGWTRSAKFPIKNPLPGSEAIHGPMVNDSFDDTGQALEASFADAFVLKLSPAGGLEYSTYLGGANHDEGNGIAVDEAGVAHIVGRTASGTVAPGNFPLTGDAYQKDFLPPFDAFFLKLDAAGQEVLYSTYLGGNAGLEVRPAVTSLHHLFDRLRPTVEATLKLRNRSTKDITITAIVLDTTRNMELIDPPSAPFSLAAGEDLELTVKCSECSVHSQANLHIKATVDGEPGSTLKLGDIFLSSSNIRIQGVPLAEWQTEAVRAAATSFGNDGDIARAVAVDKTGNAYVTGAFSSFDFPVKGMQRPKPEPEGIQREGTDLLQAFVAKFNAAHQLEYSVILGGSDGAVASGVATDDSGHAYVVGRTYSEDFPTQDPLESTPGGAFVTKLSPGGDPILFSTYLGGWSATAVALDRDANIYLTGNTGSNLRTEKPFQAAFASSEVGVPDAFVAMISQGQSAAQEVQLWQKIEIPAPTGNDGASAFKVEFVRMVGGTEIRAEAEILAIRPGFVTVRVPPGLLGPADLNAPPLGVDNNVRAEVLRASDRQEIARQEIRLRMPQPILVDEVDVRPGAPGSLRTLLQFVFNNPPPTIHTFAFLGKSSDGMLGLRVLNSELRFPAPLRFDLNDVTVFEPGGGSARLQRIGAPFTLPNLGPGNQGVQFNVTRDGLYVMAIEPSESSPGPFPARYQLHLAGNVGLPRKLVNDVPEAPRGTRLDTLFNHSAPRPQNLSPDGLSVARTALFKFANVASVSPFARAVLLPPAGGFVNGMRITRAADPPAPLEITTPTARTPEFAAPVIGNVIDFTQIPDPASVTDPSPPLAESVCAAIGENDGNAVTVPKTLASGGVIASLILDMGSGHEIVDGAGADFEVLASAGSYTVQVGNTPFADSFSSSLGPFTGVRQVDLAASGLKSARYVWITPSPSVTLDAVRNLNFLADEISPTAGPVTHVTSATITARRAKVAANKLDPFLQLILPNGDLFAENEAGFGDDLTQDLSDAALINQILPQDGFYRYLVKGFDKQPDEQSMGAFFTRLETAGAYDPVELVVGNLGEAQTPAQRTGNFSTSRQRDSYLFQAAPGQTVKIVVNATGAGPKVNPVVELHDPEDFLIAANDDYLGRERTALTATLPAQGLAVGTYRIVVSAVDGFGAASGFNGGTAHIRQAATGGYELKVFTGTMIQPEGAPRIVSLQPAQGAPGATVVIAGADFGDTPGANTVRFGAVQAVVASATATRLEVTVPAGLAAGRADVTVTVGERSSAPAMFTVVATVPDIDIQMAGLDFGEVPVGQTKDLTLTVANTGAGVLRVSSITPGNAQITVVSPSVPFEVAPGAQQSVVLRFAPQAAGAIDVGLSVLSNDPDEGTFNVPTTGRTETQDQTAQARMTSLSLRFQRGSGAFAGQTFFFQLGSLF
ncbi:MAG TPA: SBBP repeat-containing protein, partial [Verrucomicrobiales bacterium]|nr:SBBP repeat-containing protein [Verrucomicrobiales bacterium]